jgi:hypothetical protein
MDTINLTFIAFTAMAIHHCLLAWKPGEFRVQPEFGPEGGAQRMCNTRNITDTVNSAWTYQFGHVDADCHSSSPEVQVRKTDNIHSMICRRIHSTGRDPVMAQSHNNQGSIEQVLLNYVPEELIEQPDNPFDCLSSIVAAAIASMRF